MVAYDKIFEALGDPTRRSVLQRLGHGPSSVARLADGLPVSRPAVSQHLKVLRQAGLVSDRRLGTRRIYSVDPEGIAAIRDYWDRFWSQALDRYREAAAREAPPLAGGLHAERREPTGTGDASDGENG